MFPRWATSAVAVTRHISRRMLDTCLPTPSCTALNEFPTTETSSASVRPCSLALAKAAASVDAFVERVPLAAPEGEPLRLEFASFVQAIRGEAPVTVSGEDGREALAVALRIVREIERTLPALKGVGVGARA